MTDDDAGLAVRRTVLGDEYVDRALAQEILAESEPEG